MEKTIERLDTFSKILLATQSINYLANNIYGAMIDVSYLSAHNPDKKFLQDSVEQKQSVLNDTLEALKNVMEDLGNYCSGVDLIAPIDIKVTNAAFDIVIHGNDDVEEEGYPSDEEEND